MPPGLAWPDLPRALPGTPPRGAIRLDPSHFEVEEVLGFEPHGEGPHTWLLVRKTRLNSPDAARMIAKHAGARQHDVGFSGMKDRNAVTTQWFSVPVREDAVTDWSGLNADSLRILAVTRHGRKLRRGTHRANRFTIRIALAEGHRETALSRVREIGSRGFPNYFGEQRFGRDDSNLAQAARLLQGGRMPRTARSMAISAARSWLFNQVLAARVSGGTWDRVLPGEAVMLDGSRSFFVAMQPDAALAGRLDAFDVHPSGPLAGAGATPAAGEAARVERRALDAMRDWVDGLAALGLGHERRALRARPAGLEAAADTPGICLSFTLPRGVFATSLLRECIAIVPAGATPGGTRGRTGAGPG